MAGTADNNDPRSFQQANFEQAVARVVEVMRQEQPQVVGTYDENGNYGHPDHIRAHQVAVAAFDAVADQRRARLFYAVVPRSALARMGERLRAAGIEVPFRDMQDNDQPRFGVEDD